MQRNKEISQQIKYIHSNMIIQYKEYYIYDTAQNDTMQSVTRQSITQHKVLHDKKGLTQHK